MGPSTGLFDVGGQRLGTPPIRGRAGELKVIGGLMTALVQGRGGVLVIEGPPGIGKSRLVTEVLALADKGGVRTLLGEAFEYQQAVPFFSLFMATLRADPQSGTPTRCASWAARQICATGWCTICMTRFMRRPQRPRSRLCWRTSFAPDKGMLPRVPATRTRPPSRTPSRKLLPLRWRGQTTPVLARCISSCVLIRIAKHGDCLGGEFNTEASLSGGNGAALADESLVSLLLFLLGDPLSFPADCTVLIALLSYAVIDGVEDGVDA